jgi:hypothetical protein
VQPSFVNNVSTLKLSLFVVDVSAAGFEHPAKITNAAKTISFFISFPQKLHYILQCAKRLHLSNNATLAPISAASCSIFASEFAVIFCLSGVYQSKFSVRLVVSFSSLSIRGCIASG